MFTSKCRTISSEIRRFASNSLLKAGFIVAIFMHMAWERLALKLAILLPPLCLLVLIGFILNAAVPPLHAWLPDAYGEATFNVSVFMCAFTTKTAVYALCRGLAGMEILVLLGVIMALYGVVYAVLENDSRRLLAYHAVSQVGYMILGIGTAVPVGIVGGLFHMINHAMYKSCLFLTGGAVERHFGRGDFREQQLGTVLGFVYDAAHILEDVLHLE